MVNNRSSPPIFFLEVYEQYEKIKAIFDAMEFDVHKSSRGIQTAGVRVRRALSVLRKESLVLSKLTLETSDAYREKYKDREKPFIERVPVSHRNT